MLQRVIQRTQAWELLHTPDYCGQLMMGQLYDLMIHAGYSEEIAQEAASRRGWERLSANMKQ